MKINNWFLIIIFWTNGLNFICQNNNSLVKFVDYPKVKAYKANKSKNSSMFQGNKKTKKYFEGWYFKMVSQDELSILSVIPGISISEDGSTKHAFIQIIDGKTSKTEYINFSIEDFYFSKDDFLDMYERQAKHMIKLISNKKIRHSQDIEDSIKTQKIIDKSFESSKKNNFLKI